MEIYAAVPNGHLCTVSFVYVELVINRCIYSIEQICYSLFSIQENYFLPLFMWSTYQSYYTFEIWTLLSKKDFMINMFMICFQEIIAIINYKLFLKCAASISNFSNKE